MRCRIDLVQSDRGGDVRRLFAFLVNDGAIYGSTSRRFDGSGFLSRSLSSISATIVLVLSGARSLNMPQFSLAFTGLSSFF